MAVKLGTDVEVAIAIGDEEVTAVFPAYDDPEFMAEVRKLLGGRWQQKGAQQKDKSTEARVRFFNATALNIRNVEGPDGRPIDASSPGWKAKIPANWKVSFALYFEEKNSLTAEDLGNSEPASNDTDAE